MFFFGVHVCSHCLLKKTMKLLCWIWLWTLFHVGLQKAQAGKSSSSKRKRESSQSEDWNTFSMNLHAKNVLPATVAKRNIEKANKAGAQGKKFRAKKGKANAARCMFNAYPKTAWPKLYWAKVPMKNLKTDQVEERWHPFCLPHEWLAQYMADPKAVLEAQPARGSKVHAALSKICMGVFGTESWPAEGLVSIGFHEDGVPIQGTMRKEGLDFLTINLPGSKLHRDLRVPFTVIQSKFHFQYQTKEAILNILVWSLEHLKKGTWPVKRHDGTAWRKSDKARSVLHGQLPAKGILAEVRGDWDWLNSWLNIPAYNTNSGMCWLCPAKWPESKAWTAAGRSSGLSKALFVQRVLDMGKTLCPFWGLPEMAPDVLCLPDWLHTVDQGIGADIAAQLLIELSACYPGRSFKLRVAGLWQDIQSLYSEHATEYKLRTLTPEVLNKGKGKPANTVPTLKGPAAVIRHLIPLLPILTAKHFGGGTEHQVACDKLARFLAQTYASMETNDIKSLPKLGAKVAGQYMALERHALRNDSIAFHIMPKMHLFQHICECGFAPKEFWCYQDETTGGFLAKLFTRKGGWDNPGKNCENMFLRWQQLTSFPCVPVD